MAIASPSELSSREREWLETANSEGGIVPDVPFEADTIDHYATQVPMQAAGAALLRLAWRHRQQLLG